ncbi:MAG: ThiF family adenylyltransferase [Myxococcota bacterium]
MREGAETRLLAQFGAADLRRLAEATLAIVGLGTVGGGLSLHAALLGVRQLLVDCGLIDVENLGSQSFPDISVGDPKVFVRAWQARLLNGDCPVEPIHARVEDLGFARLADADLLVSSLDSRRSRLAVNELSLSWKIPMLDLAVAEAGQGLLGSVALYHPGVEGSACYACRMEMQAFAAASREGRPAGCPSWRARSAPVTAPTLASSALAAITSGFGMLWAIETLAGRSEALAGRLLLLQGLPVRVSEVRLTRSPRCVAEHHSSLPLREPAGDTVGDLFETACRDLAGEPEVLVLHGRVLAFGLVCERCGDRSGLVRATQALTDDEVRCDRCGAEEMVPLALRDRLLPSEAKPLFDLHWPELGLPEDDVASAVLGDRITHYRVHPRSERGTHGRKESSW